MERESAASERAMDSLDRATEQADHGQNSPKPRDDNHDTLLVESEPKVASKPIGNFYFKRYRATWILLVLFIVTVAVAFSIYPRRSAVYRPQSFTVIVQAQEAQVQSIGIQVKRLQPDQFSLTIGTLVNSPGFQGKVPLLLIIDVPATVTPQSCRPPSCTSILANSLEGIYQVEEKIITQLSRSVTKLIVDAPVLAWDANGLDVEAELPEVEVDYTNPRQPQNNPEVGISYTLPPGYDWTTPEPYYSPESYILGDPSGATEALIWRETANDLENPVPISGTDNSTASGDSFRTFISGALLGIAGGALVGAIQEATHTKRRAKKPEPIPALALIFHRG